MIGLRWRRLPALAAIIVLVGLLLPGAVAEAVLAPGSYLDKVVLMLQEMKVKSESLKQAADTQYQEVAAACTSNLETNAQEVQNLDLQVQGLEATVQQLDVDIRQLNFDISQYQVDLERFAQDEALSKKENAEMTAAFHRDIAAFDAAIGAAERAKLILQAQLPTARPAAALLLETARRAAASTQGLRAGRHLRHAVSLLQRDSETYSPDNGGMAKDEHLFDEFDGVSARTEGLSGQVDSLEGIIDEVLVLFRSNKESVIQSADLTRKDFDETVAALQQQITTNRASLATAQEALGTKKSSLVSKTQELEDARESFASTKTYREELTKACDEKQADHQELTTLRANEITTLSKAIELLSAVGASSSQPTAASLLRRGARVVRGAGAGSDDGESKVLGFLRVEAKKLASVSLQRLAGEVEAVVDGGLAVAASSAADAVGPEARQDALNKVKEMIQDLVTKLQTEAAAEATHNSWCETELRKNEMSKKTAQADIEKHTVTVKQLEAALEQLNLEITDLNSTIARLDTDRSQLIVQRNTSRDENLAAVADAQQSADAVEAALAMIEEYYKNATKAVSLVKRTQVVTNGTAASLKTAGSTAAKRAKQLPEAVTRTPVSGPQLEESQGVVAMLQVVRDGYRELETKTTKKEQEAAAAFVEELRDHDVMAVSAVKDRDFKLEMQSTYQTQLADTGADLQTATQALADAATTYEQLKPPCVTGETYEERVAKREQEVAALEEAYDMLTQYAQEMGYALLQGAPRQASTAHQLAMPVKAVKAVVQWGSGSAPAAPAAPVAPVVAAAPAAVAAAAAAPTAQPRRPPQPLRLATVAAAGAATAVKAPAVPVAHLAVARAQVVAAAGEPVTEVTSLLLEIKAEVQADLTEDIKVYEDTKEWCDKAIAQSQAAIAAADARDQELMTAMEVSVQGKASLEVELARLKEELAKEQESLSQQDSIRQRTADSFHENEKELLEATYALSHALEVLQSRYSNVANGRDYAAEREQLEAEKQASGAGDTTGTSDTASTGSEPMLTGLVAVAGEVKQALSALPPQEANVVNTLVISSALQDFLAQPAALFPDAAAAPRHGHRASLSLAVSKVRASPEGTQIFGILQQLLDTFKADLQALREREAQDKSTYDALKASKFTQVDALQNSITLKEAQYAQDSSTNANAKEELASVRASRKAEYQHLLGVQEHCRQVEAEFNVRNATRLEELGSLAEAIAILGGGADTAAPVSSDQALQFHAAAGAAGQLHVLAARLGTGALRVAPPTARPAAAAAAAPTPKPRPENVVDMYLKAHSGTVQQLPKKPSPIIEALRNRRSRRPFTALSAKQVLAAHRRPTPVVPVLTVPRKSLTALALRSHLQQTEPDAVTATINDAFDKVGTMLDNIRNTLIAEKQREVEFHDRCTDEKHQAEMQLARREHDKETLTAAIQRLDSLASESEAQVSEVGNQITALSQSLEEAKTQRTDDAAAYGTTIEEQEAHQAKLHQAIQKLSVYYGKAALLEQRQDPPAEPETTTTRPGGFAKPMEKHAGGHGIMSILQLLVEQSEVLVKSMQQSEQEARDAYGANVATTNEAISQKNREVVAMSAAKSSAELEKEQTQARLTACETEIAEINSFIAVVQDKCGWILSNFAESQTARQGQIENMRTAKETIRGAMFSQ